MTFSQAMDEYHRLQAQLSAGQITPQAFEAAVNRLLVKDSQGQSWTIGVETGKWYRLEGEQWVEDTPAESAAPAANPPAPPPPAASSAAGAAAPAPAPKKKTVNVWLIVGLVALCLALVGGTILVAGVGGYALLRSSNDAAPVAESNEMGVSPTVAPPVATAPAIPTSPAENTPTANPQPVPPLPSTRSAALSTKGPWVILPDENGIWAMNPDGSGLSQLVKETIRGPQDLHSAVRPDGQKIAYITSDSNLRGLKLQLLDLKTGQVETLTRLTTDQTEPPTNPEICDPAFEAARALTIGNGLAWSPDGENLAFTAVLEGDTADLYVLNLATRQITRLTDDPSQEFDLHWSPGGQIVHFGASCFGTGGGFAMTGAWATSFDSGKTISLYTPDTTAMYEDFLNWVYGTENAFFVATASGCPYRDLRIVDAESGEVTPVFDGCMEDAVPGPTASWYVLAGEGSSQKPGLYIYLENHPGNVFPPTFVPLSDARELRLAPNGILVEIQDPDGPHYVSFDWNGKDNTYAGDGSLPWIDLLGESWAVEKQGVFYLEGKDHSPLVLSEDPVAYPYWYEEVAPDGSVPEHLLYYAQPEDGEGYSLYLATPPDFQPVSLAEGMAPSQTPFRVFLR
ncbi:MAG: hypothetical protein GYA59_17055 [Chloroflexi bacterium]|nr:hypothetical protein [Chloroflexota bacterium]